MDMIGRYEVKGELGRGGMAIVYRAIDPKIGREVAIKVLPREFMQEADFLSRFQREVRTVGQLNHAAIVPLYDTGEDNGQPYLVMRLMNGGSLLDRVKRGALPLNEVVAIFNRLGGALDEAHSKGIIHRDLKPGNILLDELGQPYLADFGIAKLIEATSMTSRGVIGTPAYMSPEHFEGQVNPRSDVYAMGMILFQLLTGRLPFQAQTPTEWLKAHLMDTPPSLRSISPNLPSELEPILQRALAKSHEARYGTVGEMARALSEVRTADGVNLADKATVVDTSLMLSQRSGTFADKPTVVADSQPMDDKPTVVEDSQPMADKATVVDTSPMLSQRSETFADKATVVADSQPVGEAATQRSASQAVSQPVARPTQSGVWGWLNSDTLMSRMIYGAIVVGLGGVIVEVIGQAIVMTIYPHPHAIYFPINIAIDGAKCGVIYGAIGGAIYRKFNLAISGVIGGVIGGAILGAILWVNFGVIDMMIAEAISGGFSGGTSGVIGGAISGGISGAIYGVIGWVIVVILSRWFPRALGAATNGEKSK